MRLLAMSMSIALVVACSAVAQSDAGQAQAKQHYRIALEALHDNNLSIASEELDKALELAPDNALIHYYLGLVQSKQSEPAKALENVQRALSLGLPNDESAAAGDLLIHLQYEIKRPRSKPIASLQTSSLACMRESEGILMTRVAAGKI